MINNKVFTKTELEVINRRIKNEPLSNQDSYYLSKSIRPKLIEISKIDANLLNKLEYNQKGIAIEKKIVKVLLDNLNNIDSIILYGSAIQTNYKEYNDIDILIVTKEEIKPIKQKIKEIIKIKDKLKENKINADIEIYSKEIIENCCNTSPSLIYQLKDSKIIYGNIKIKNNIEIYKLELIMKLDWSYIEDNPENIEIYKSIRNIILVRLLINKIVDNKKLKESLYDELGKNLIIRLKNNDASKSDRKIALNYLKSLLEKTEKEVNELKWEKMELLSP